MTTRPLSDDELTAIFNTIDLSTLDKLFVFLGCYSGLRMSELLSLKRSNFTVSDNLLYFTCHRRYTKGKHKSVEIRCISSRAIALFNKHCEVIERDYNINASKIGADSTNMSDFYIFASDYFSFPYSARTMNYHIRSMFPTDKYLPFISAHSFRKTYARKLYEQTGSIELVRIGLNHRTLASTHYYLSFLHADLLSVT